MGFSNIFNGGGNQTQGIGTAIGSNNSLPTTNAGIQNAAANISTGAGAGINSLGNASLNNASTTVLGMGLGSNPAAAQQMQQLKNQQQSILNQGPQQQQGMQQQQGQQNQSTLQQIGSGLTGALNGFSQGSSIGGMFGPVGSLIGGGIGALGSLFSQ
jgi:hypothetical protein